MAVTVLLLLTLALLAFCTSTAVAARDLSETQSIPASIRVPEDDHHHYKLHQTLHARGFQFYKYNGSTWMQFNASARLYNADQKQVGRHYFLATVDAEGGQPTWESFPSKINGGVPFSSVTGRTVSRVEMAADSIVWLLLQRTQSKGSTQYFGDTEYVQRINTKLGLGPTSTKGASVGDVKQSPYTADYLFYVSET